MSKLLDLFCESIKVYRPPSLTLTRKIVLATQNHSERCRKWCSESHFNHHVVSPSSTLSSGNSTTKIRTSGTSITASMAATLDREARAHLLVPSKLVLHLYLSFWVPNILTSAEKLILYKVPNHNHHRQWFHSRLSLGLANGFASKRWMGFHSWLIIVYIKCIVWCLFILFSTDWSLTLAYTVRW